MSSAPGNAAAMTAQPLDLAEGRVLAATWRLERRLGAGGLASVWAASHLGTGQRAAIKVLHARHAGDFEVRARFAREAYAANQIPHPGVVRVLADGMDGGAAFLALELVVGASLKASP